ncbi:MAG TPA: alpha/beta fold hydrolase [Bryobacteraceae bacterium]|nr:alpha/beta fold hydrolase [Bryobacteraceae bacterium]
MRPFIPLFRNAHLLTVAGNFWPRPLDIVRFPVRDRYYAVEPGVEILVHEQQPQGTPRGQIVLVHGLEGGSDSGYMRSLAQAALERGFGVHRFHMRSCGGTESRSGNVLYHSGQTGDLKFVTCTIAEERGGSLFLTGFSLGGNVVLKLAGELGEDAATWIAGVCAVSTPIDLGICARSLEKPSNFLYENRFLGRLKDRIRRKAALMPGLFCLEDLPRAKTVRDFDDLFTARCFGFGTAEHYYESQSSGQYLERIRIPALLVQAKDDPLIPFEIYNNHPAFRRNPNLRLLAIEHGGHLGFLSWIKPRFWLDETILEFLESLESGNKRAGEFVPLRGEFAR